MGPFMTMVPSFRSMRKKEMVLDSLLMESRYLSSSEMAISLGKSPDIGRVKSLVSIPVLSSLEKADTELSPALEQYICFPSWESWMA